MSNATAMIHKYCWKMLRKHKSSTNPPQNNSKQREKNEGMETSLLAHKTFTYLENYPRKTLQIITVNIEQMPVSISLITWHKINQVDKEK